MLNFSKDANIKIKEDYEGLEERYSLLQNESDKLVGELRDEVKIIQEKTRTLQDFYDKYDDVMQEQREDFTQQLRTLRKEKDATEADLKKQLAATQSDYETL